MDFVESNIFSRYQIDKKNKKYKIYTTPDNFTEIDAEHVADALKKAKIKHPFKIEFYKTGTHYIFNNDELLLAKEDHLEENSEKSENEKSDPNDKSKTNDTTAVKKTSESATEELTSTQSSHESKDEKQDKK